jgi:hypothetical protein
MKPFIFAIITATSAITTLAAPPAGHPSPQVANEMLAPAKVANPAELPNEGRVLNVLQAGEYTYVEVSNGSASRWLAAPQTALHNGNVIRYEEGSTMSSFQSKLLKRSFSNLMFIGQLAVISKK